MGWDPDSPEAGDFSGLHAMMRNLQGLIDWLDVLSSTVMGAASNIQYEWTGPAADTWGEAGVQLASAAIRKSEEARTLRSAVKGYLDTVPGYLVGEVESIKRARQFARQDKAAAEKRLASEQLVNPGAGYVSPEVKRIAEFERRIVDCEQQLTAWREQRTSYDAKLATAMRAADFTIGTLITDLGLDLPPGSQFGDGIPIPVTLTGGFGQGTADDQAAVNIPVWWFISNFDNVPPEAVRSRWDTLTQAQRDALTVARPDLIGNLDGIPLANRCQANQTNIQNEINRLVAEKARLDGLGESSPTKPPLPGEAVVGLQAQSDEIQKQINYYRSLLDWDPKGKKTDYDPKEPDPSSFRNIQFGPDGSIVETKGSQVIMFDPKNKGIAIYHGAFDKNGDIPSTYTNVGLYVPGTGTQPWKFGNPDQRASELHVDSNRLGPGSQAMIVWSGGPQPQLADAVIADYAQYMGPKLARFAAVYVPEDPTFTIVGHSYGATTVAQAEATGLKADRVLYVAPAGYGEGPTSWSGRPEGTFIRGLEDFPNTKDVPHYSMISRNDPVVGLIQRDPFGLHGDSPTADPDVTRLETGWLDSTSEEGRRLGYLDDNKGSHSTPFNRESTAYSNMLAVINGGTAQGYGGDIYNSPYAPDGIPNYKDEGDWPDVKIQ